MLELGNLYKNARYKDIITFIYILFKVYIWVVKLISFFAFLFCGTTLLFGFLLPAFALLQLLYQQGLSIDIRYFDWLSNSLSVALITSIISVLLALFFAYAVRLNSRLSWVNRLLGFGYALPGAVLAIGVLSFLEIFQLAWWVSVSLFILISM